MFLGSATPQAVVDMNWSLLVGALVLLVAVAAVRLSTRSGLPSLLLYLGIGLAIGESGLGIDFNSQALTQALGYAALVLILAEGGLTTSWAGIKDSVRPAIVLSTVGVGVSVAVVATAGHFLLALPWTTALIIGAILASTDAAAVFSVLRVVPLPRKITGILEAESGFNDAPVVLLVVAFVAQASPGATPDPWWWVGVKAVLELVGGALIGLGIGWLGGRILTRVAGSSALFSIGILALTVLAYAAGATVHASGFLATYVAALVLGNMGLPYYVAVRSFATAMGWLAQIGLFVLLGLVASPTDLPQQIVPAIVLGLVLLLVARPLSVLVSLLPFNYNRPERLFLSWAGLRGAVPVVLATVPSTAGTPHTDWIFDLVFVLVVIFTIVQGPTLAWVAQRLRLTDGISSQDLDVETTPLTELDAHILSVSIGPTSQLQGVEVFELRLPKGSNVTMVVRDGEQFVPDKGTRLRHGDHLLIVTTRVNRAATTARLQAISQDGRLAGWQ